MYRLSAMADIFVSYSRRDLARARPVLGAFDRLRWSVYFDLDNEPGERWDERIEAELNAARSMVVLLSQNVLRSVWVPQEVHHFRTLSRLLLPIWLEPMQKIPFWIRTEQWADLSDWCGELHEPCWRVVYSALRAELDQPDLSPGAPGGDQPRATGTFPPSSADAHTRMNNHRERVATARAEAERRRAEAVRRGQERRAASRAALGAGRRRRAATPDDADPEP
jgi:hypothetical protein